jgi:hypothetical protein
MKRHPLPSPLIITHLLCGTEAAPEVPAGPEPRKLNVYGVDQRAWFDWDSYPDRAFGKLMFPKAYFCTGELIGR